MKDKRETKDRWDKQEPLVLMVWTERQVFQGKKVPRAWKVSLDIMDKKEEGDQEEFVVFLV